MKARGTPWTTPAFGVESVGGDVLPGSVKRHVRPAIENVRAALEAAGTDLAHVAKTTCFVTRREDLSGSIPSATPTSPRRRRLRRSSSAASSSRSSRSRIDAIAVVP